MCNVIAIQAAFADAAKTTNAGDAQWAEPIPLPTSLLPVPNFDANLLPTRLRPWVEDIADRMNVPLDYVAIPAMVSASSLVGGRVGVCPTRYGDWMEAGNLWGCIVGSPGRKKTPAVSEALKPLGRLQSNARQAYLNELAHHDDQLAALKFERAAAERKAQKAANNGDAEAVQNALQVMGEPQPPAEPRFVVNDATVEKLGEISRDNPFGLLCHRDEIMTLFTQLDHPSAAPARSYFLSAWRGLDAYTWDRIGRGTVHIPRANLALLGTTQPDRISSLVRSVQQGGDDGLLARVQLLAWPDPIDDFKVVDRLPHEAARDEAFECYRQLSHLNEGMAGADIDPFGSPDQLPFLRFVPDAVEVFHAFRGRLHQKTTAGLLPNLVLSHLSKYDGLVARLTLLTHLASGGRGSIGVNAVEVALRWIDYLEPHAMRAYHSANIDNAATARLILRRIEKGDLSGQFTARDVYKNHWSGLANGPGLNGALDLLDETNWLRASIRSNGGRPTTVYEINPGVDGTRSAIAA